MTWHLVRSRNLFHGRWLTHLRMGNCSYRTGGRENALLHMLYDLGLRRSLFQFPVRFTRFQQHPTPPYSMSTWLALNSSRMRSKSKYGPSLLSLESCLSKEIANMVKMMVPKGGRSLRRSLFCSPFVRKHGSLP